MRCRSARAMARIRSAVVQSLEVRRHLAAEPFFNLSNSTLGSSPTSFVAMDGLVAFAATGATGTELYATDGTSAGTRLVKDINVGAGSSSPAELKFWRDRLYF